MPARPLTPRLIHVSGAAEWQAVTNARTSRMYPLWRSSDTSPDVHGSTTPTTWPVAWTAAVSSPTTSRNAAASAVGAALCTMTISPAGRLMPACCANRHDPELVRQTVHLTAERYGGAEVHTFVPVLVERDTRRALDALNG